MNAQSHEEISLKVIEFLSNELSIPKDKVVNKNSFFHDYGVDGDDAVELFKEYSIIFNVSLKNFDIDKYFGLEVTIGPVDLLKILFTKDIKYKSVPRFTVEDMIQGVISGELK